VAEERADEVVLRMAEETSVRAAGWKGSFLPPAVRKRHSIMSAVSLAFRAARAVGNMRLFSSS
jgi:hypothetical protein